VGSIRLQRGLKYSVAGSAAAPRPLFSRKSSFATRVSLTTKSVRSPLLLRHVCVAHNEKRLLLHVNVMARLRQTHITEWLDQSAALPLPTAEEDIENAQRGLQGVEWPAGIERRHVSVNPSGVAFHDLTGDLGQCSCVAGCLRGRCVNATAGIFCDVANCGSVNCWNRCQELPCLALVATRTGLGVASMQPLPPGINVGEYCGVLRRGAEITRVMEQSGFGFKFSELSATGECIFIDASQSGSLCRFMNHSCVANCRFEVMTNRCARKVVVVTCEFLPPGSELTVSYGRQVRFKCLCAACVCTRPPGG